MNCGHKVYDWTEEGPKVARPYDCVVGCASCANLCAGRAISFPDVENLRDLYRREKIWAKVKERLIEEGKLS
jgi:formate hydrogenlyase subunit 6/NADH:ubiquinone oxidoreductase subunit I